VSAGEEEHFQNEIRLPTTWTKDDYLFKFIISR